MLLYWIWFAELPELRASEKLALLERFSDPEDIFHTGAAALEGMNGITVQMEKVLAKRDLTQAKTILSACRKKDIGILPFGDNRYPARLRNIDDPPFVLYYRGEIPDFARMPAIAVVGTRKATAYGMSTALQMSRQVAACGALVVSGGAAGIDTMALRGALDAQQPAVAVLGCGVDVIYPKSNKQLFARLQESGCIFSEYPPGTRPYAWNFPRRNRILSGMSNGVLVVEAPEKSGALITAGTALDQGRDVFVVPGNIDVAACAGSNALLRGCAGAVFSGWDIVREYQTLYPGAVAYREVSALAGMHSEPMEARVAQEPARPANKRTAAQKADKKDIDIAAVSPYDDTNTPPPSLSPEEAAVAALVELTPKPVDEIIAASGLPAAKVLGILTMLSLKGIVINHPGKCVSAKRELSNH